VLTRPALVAVALALSLPAAAQRRHRRPARDAGAPVTPPTPPRDPAAECRAACGRAREQCCARSGVNGVCDRGCADVGHFCEMDCDRRFQGPRPSARPEL